MSAARNIDHEEVFENTYLMPHRLKPIEPEEGRELTGYTGKILLVNLTDESTRVIDSRKYLPHYIGGWAACNALFYDLVKTPITEALSEENLTIFMPGPAAGTAIPISGRMEICGVSGNSIPTQYTHSNMSCQFSATLKYAGYDGLVVTGKAKRHTYVYVENDKVEFRDADEEGLWGQLVWESQQQLKDRFGNDVQSLVIGPAGENLNLNASITNSNDSVSAKAGFGAVWGYKNLKAVCVKGTGRIKISIDLDTLLKQRMQWGNPPMAPNPQVFDKGFYCFGADAMQCEDEWGTWNSRICGCKGCNNNCSKICYDCHDPLNPGGRVAETVKCVEAWAANHRFDCDMGNSFYIYSKRSQHPGSYVFAANAGDPDDPDAQLLSQWNNGDRYDHFKPSMEMGQSVNILCTQYGIDKWEIIVWMMTWISRSQKEGLLDGIDFGMEVDMDNPEFMRHMLRMVTYREGPEITLADGTRRRIGDVFADGMARAIRALGKEKYGDTIYTGRTNMRGERLDIPVSNESAWGTSSHWTGRGFQGCPKILWLPWNLGQMVDTRDTNSSAHLHLPTDLFYEAGKNNDPARCMNLARFAIVNGLQSMLKDTIGGCEWHTPDTGRPEQEAEMMTAATGVEMDELQLYDACAAGKLLYRGILMRDYGRCRDMEVEEVYPWLTYPDPNNEVVNWDEWNDFVDLFYEANGWDIATGWPYRSTWEAYGLGYVADDLEKLGMVPPEDGTPGYVRKENPFGR